MRLNDLSFVLLRRVWCEHPPSRITQGTSKRCRRAATPSKSKQAAKRGHLPGRRGVALSRFIRQIIAFAERVGPLHSTAFNFFFFLCWLISALPHNCFLLYIRLSEAGCVGCVWMLTRFKTRLLRSLKVIWFIVDVSASSETTHSLTQSQYSPADKSTIIQPSQWQRFRVHGRRRGPPRSPSSSGDLTPPLRTLIDYLQAQHGGPHRLSSFLFPLATLHSFIINKSFFLLHDSRLPPRRPLRSQAAGVLCCVR